MHKNYFQYNLGVPQLSVLSTQTLTTPTTEDVTTSPRRVSVSLDTPASSVRVSENLSLFTLNVSIYARVTSDCQQYHS